MKRRTLRAPKGFSPTVATIACLSLATTLLVGCRREKAALPAAPAADVVATIDGLSISPTDLAEALAKRSKAIGAGRSDAQLKQEVLDDLIHEKVLLAKARAAGVDRDPELIRRWERMVVAKYETAHKPDAEKQRPPTATEVHQFYQAHAGEYQRPERIRVATIQVKGSAKATEEKRAELRSRAEKVLVLAQTPDADFAELARLHSEDRATRYSGGDSGWMEHGQTPPSWPLELTEAVFALKSPGVVAPLIEAGASFYVVKLIEYQPAGSRSLPEVRDRIVHQLKEKQRVTNEQHFYAEQRAGLKIEINAAALQAVPLPSSAIAKAPDAPPSLPAN